MGMGRKSKNPLYFVSGCVRRQPPKVKAFLGVMAGIGALVFLKFVVEDHNKLFIAAEAIHALGIAILIYKLMRLKTCAGSHKLPSTFGAFARRANLGNLGQSAFAWVLRDSSHNLVASHSGLIPFPWANNVAKYFALIKALELVAIEGITKMPALFDWSYNNEAWSFLFIEPFVTYPSFDSDQDNSFSQKSSPSAPPLLSCTLIGRSHGSR
eukprot:Gb_35685 [translate_table: standard]